MCSIYVQTIDVERSDVLVHANLTRISSRYDNLSLRLCQFLHRKRARGSNVIWSE